MTGPSGRDITEFARERREACTLYLISRPRFDARHLDEIKAALDGGPVAVFQLRLKETPDADILSAAATLKPLLNAYDVALVINDRVDLAKQTEADGVHLGQTDGSVKRARALLGFDRAIGVSCHGSRHLAMVAGEAGADYVAFGAFFPSRTKSPPAYANLEILSWWVSLAELPCVAIGGITVENCPPLIAAGADMIAVSSGVWDHAAGPGAAVAAFNAAFQA